MRFRRTSLIAIATLCACSTSKESTNSATIERTPVYYDSTRSAGIVPSGATDPDASACPHAWVAGKPHAFWDISFDPPMVALCTPVRCTKCGEERHECAPRTTRKK